jgi:hypothetical protein
VTEPEDWAETHCENCGDYCGHRVATAARLVVALDRRLRRNPGDPHDKGSTRAKKDQARLNGALLVWEALTGLPSGEALDAARGLADEPFRGDEDRR